MKREPEVEQADAAQNIVDEFLMDGEIYPEGRYVHGSRLKTYQRDAVTIGDFLIGRIDDNDVANALTALVSGNSEGIDNVRDYLKRVCEGAVAGWLLDKFPQHVQTRVEQLREQAEEREADREDANA